MNIAFEHYKHLLNLEVKKYEEKYGDLLENAYKHFDDNLHTMQVNKEDLKAYENSYLDSEIYDYADLSCLENYERILSKHSGEFN